MGVEEEVGMKRKECEGLKKDGQKGWMGMYYVKRYGRKNEICWAFQCSSIFIVKSRKCPRRMSLSYI